MIQIPLPGSDVQMAFDVGPSPPRSDPVVDVAIAFGISIGAARDAIEDGCLRFADDHEFALSPRGPQLALPLEPSRRP